MRLPLLLAALSLPGCIQDAGLLDAAADGHTPPADARPPDRGPGHDVGPLDLGPLDLGAPDLGPPDLGEVMHDRDVPPAPPPDMAPPPTWDSDIGPLFRRAICTEGGCHDMRGLSAGLSLTSYAGFLAGGQSGIIHGNGDPTRALLIDRLRGRNGLATMALGRTPRPEAEIALVEAWIAQGFPEF